MELAGFLENTKRIRINKVGCPEGYGLGYLKQNDTLFIACHPAYYQDTLNANARDGQELGIILGSALGSVAGLFLLIFIIQTIRRRNYRVSLNTLKNIVVPTAKTPILSAKEKVTSQLSAGGLHDFEYGYLSPSLRDEIMIIRLKQGRDLTEFVEYAEKINCPHIATFIRDLHPGMIPADICKTGRQFQQGATPMPTAPPLLGDEPRV